MRPSVRLLPSSRRREPARGSASAGAAAQRPGSLRPVAATAGTTVIACLLAVATATLGLGPDPARAQLIGDGSGTTAAPRIAPQAVLGVLVPGVFPEASLDGRRIRVGGGFRLFDESNRIVVPGSVLGRRLVVAYVTGPVGEVTTAWIVTEAERKAIRRRQ